MYNKKQLEAIRQSMEMWRWLKDNPLMDKDDYPFFGYNIASNLFHCPCCEIFMKRKPDTNWLNWKSCTKCPLIPKNQSENQLCIKDYYNWEYSLSEEVKGKAATKIFKILEKAYILARAEQLKKGK